MAGTFDRDEVVREQLRVGVEPPARLDEFLANHAAGSADPFVFLPSPQGLVPVLFWTEGLRNVVIQAMKEFEDYGGDHFRSCGCHEALRFLPTDSTSE